MIVVYEAPNQLEAQMIVNLLHQEGISTSIIGQDLTGAVGELPATNLVQVLAAESDFERAKQIIQEWESSQEFNPPQKPHKKSSVLFPFVLGALVSSAATLWFTYSPITEEATDYNQDGTPDSFNTWYGNFLKEVRADRNFDGNIDSIIEYNRGFPSSQSSDDDFDGDFETTISYKSGNPYTLKVNRNNPLSSRYLQHFKDGVLNRAEFRNANGVVVKLQMFDELGFLTKAHFDEDQDGNFDTTIVYDQYEEVVAKKAFENDA